VPNKTKVTRPETGQSILLLDYETSPHIGYTWDTWQVNVIKIIQHKQIISAAWKWLGKEKTHVLALPDFKEYKKNRKSNKMLMEALANDVLPKADIIVGHNIKQFDDKQANRDIIKHKLAIPPPHRMVDTLEFARHKFGFTSNKLDDLCEFLGIGRKLKHPGFSMWEGCLDGDMAMWNLMRKYNAHDVDPLLEGVYLRFRPWMTNHPNMSAPIGLEGCPACLSKNLKPEGHRYNQSGKTPRFSCRDCGKWSTGKIVKIPVAGDAKQAKPKDKMLRFS
jgi:hypothetical protein